MSVLETILYIVIGTATITYIGLSIFKMIYYKKHPEKKHQIEKKKADKEND